MALAVNQLSGFGSRVAASVETYQANAVRFDGTSDYLEKGTDLSGNADGKSGVFSLWFNLKGGDGQLATLYQSRTTDGGGALAFGVLRLSDNTLRVVGATAAPATILVMDSDSTYVAAGGWVHLLASWDLANTQGWLYVNDSDDLKGGSTFTDGSVNYTVGFHGVGARTDGTQFLDADLADVYFNVATHYDLTTEDNRRKFRNASGKPVDLSSDGSEPTGTAPIMYFSGVTADWHTNKGSGGGFTENGALTDGASSPSA